VRPNVACACACELRGIDIFHPPKTGPTAASHETDCVYLLFISQTYALF